jgi:hypothetical protein
MTYKRDGIKKALSQTDNKQFEIQFEMFLKEKGINSNLKSNGSGRHLENEK